MQETEYVVITDKPLWQGMVNTIVTFGFILLCIYVSLESTAWTVISVIMFLFFLYVKTNITPKRFKNKDELLKYLERNNER